MQWNWLFQEASNIALIVAKFIVVGFDDLSHHTVLKAYYFWAMAYILTHFWPGATEEQYRAEIASVHPNNGLGLPEGQLYHAAGQTEGGVLIVAIWDSKGSSDRFVAEVLMPHVPEPGGLSGEPEEHSAECFNLLTQ